MTGRNVDDGAGYCTATTPGNSGLNPLLPLRRETEMDLQELIARVEAATSADRELDVLLMVRLGRMRDINGDGTMFDRGNDGYWSTYEGDERNTPLPSPTASTDAALALVGRVLPGWAWEVKLYPGETGAFAQVWVPMQPRERDVKAPTPALALILAMLRALPTEAKP